MKPRLKPGREGLGGFYEQALSEAEQLELPVALEVDGVDQEIAMLRLRLRNVLEEQPKDVALLLRGMETLRRLVATKYGLSADDRAEMSVFEQETRRRLRERGEGKSGV